MFKVSDAKEIRAILEALDLPNGWTAKIGSVRYGADMRVTLTVSRMNEAGRPAEFDRNAKVFGFDPERLWHCPLMLTNGRMAKVTGINLRARRYPFLATTDDGSTYKVPLTFVRREMEAAR